MGSRHRPLNARSTASTPARLSRSISAGGRLFFLGALASGAAACTKAPVLKAFKAARTSVESTVTTVSTGTVEAEQQAVLAFTAVGRVARISVGIGDRVKKGQALAELENSDLRTIFDEAGRETKRVEELLGSGLVSKVAFDEARKNLEVARASYEKSLMRAPFDGVITEMNLKLGELAQASASTAIAAPVRIIDMKPRIIKGVIDEVDLSKVRADAAARVRILAVRRDPFSAKVVRVVPYVSTTKEQDRTSQIELRLVDPADPEKIPVGASADIEVIVDSKTDVLAVPARAVLGTAESRYVYRVQDGRARKIPISIGTGNYERAQITSGLTEGDTILMPSDDVTLKDDLKVKVELQKWP